MAINKNELTIEQVKKAMQCENAEELMELAKAEGFSITEEEAEAYVNELADIDLDDVELKKIAGGDGCYMDCLHDKCPNFFF